ncbi:hypothetical protein ACFFX0_03745 [Citricoccus parietis]|uniref:Secreted protein n=1 Tax=Citricoccus parietis TaxID=592307 RepID=A0ABV5FUK1_9MICC
MAWSVREAWARWVVRNSSGFPLLLVRALTMTGQFCSWFPSPSSSKYLSARSAAIFMSGCAAWSKSLPAGTPPARPVFCSSIATG